MKPLIIYSSQTGNTRKIALAMAEEDHDITCLSIDEITTIDVLAYDMIYLGYWVNQGDMDQKSKQVIKHLKNHTIALFGTLGAKVDSSYYAIVKQCVEANFEGMHIIGHHLCQGSVSENVIERYREICKKSPGDIHKKAQLDAYEEGITHPNEEDIQDAVAFLHTMMDGYDC